MEFQTFYRENLSLVYRFVYSKVGNREEAEDLTSQIFMKAIRSLDLQQGLYSTRKWLFQVARTTLVDYWRASNRKATSSLDALLETGWEAPAATEELSAIANNYADRVQNILQALPGQYREVLTYRFLLNLSIRDTALKMGVTETNAKTLQFRALKQAAKLEIIVQGSVPTILS